MARPLRLTLLLPALALLAFSPIGQAASDCTYRKDSLGNTRYQCQDGRHGTLRTDSRGTVKDTGCGTTWRKDALGNVRSSDGTTYRQDSLGNVRASNSKSGLNVTWCKDSFGNLRASYGTVCRTDSLGTLRCDGGSTPPAILHTK